jgi:LuxR family maltose regulon positive regulatory protein
MWHGSCYGMSIPGAPPVILHRSSLIDMLREAILGIEQGADVSSPGKAVLVCAPAGYGKTTLLADLLQHLPLPSCWCALTAQCTDPLVLLKVLVTGIRRCFPAFGTRLSALLETSTLSEADVSRPCPTSTQATALIDALVTCLHEEIPEPFVLVLDRCHEISNAPDMKHLMMRLFKDMPSKCIVVIESRFHHLKSYQYIADVRQVTVIDYQHLRFSPAELCELAHLYGVAGLSESEAAGYDGWIMGILLGTRLGEVHRRALAQEGAVAHLQEEAHARSGTQALLTYLKEDVFKGVPHLLTFLKRAALLSEMTPALCRAVLDLPEAADYLAALEQQGLFVQSHPGEMESYYFCHPVVRRLLRDELRAQEPVVFARLQQRAVEVLCETAHSEQALEQALESRDHPFAAALILHLARSVSTQEQAVKLAHWIDALPVAIRADHPRLLLVRASTHLALGAYREALPLLDEAEAALTRSATGLETESESEPDGFAELVLARAAALFQAGKYEQARQICQDLLEKIAPDALHLRAQALQRMGTSACLLGRYGIGLKELQYSLELWKQTSDQRHIAQLHHLLANAYGLQGQQGLAAHHHSRALQSWEILRDEWGKVESLIGLGVTKQRQGDLVEAEAVLSEALKRARNDLRFHRGEAYALVSLGELYLEQQDYERALVSLEDGLHLAHRLDDHHLLQAAQRCLALVYLFMGDAQTARLLLTRAAEQQPENKATPYDRAMHHLVTGTVLLSEHLYQEARAHLSEALTTFQTTRLPREQLQALLRLGVCCWLEQERRAASQHLQEAGALAQRHRYHRLLESEVHFWPFLMDCSLDSPSLGEIKALLSPERSARLAPAVQPLPSSQLQVLAFGDPLVMLNGNPVTHWRMLRTMELFFFLLDADKPIHKERILAALWPDELQEQALRSSIYYLRKIMGKASVVYCADCYWLDLSACYGEHVYYDVSDFLERYEQARKLFSEKQYSEAEQWLLPMKALYRGDYLRSVYSDWCTLRREKLRQVYIDALSKLAQILWERQDLEACIQEWQAVLELDACLEEAHQQLALCYLRQGKRSKALRQYQECARLLEEELGVKPGAAFRALYREIADS